MAVFKWWFVTVFYFTTQFLYRSYGDEKEEIEKCLDTLAELRGLATGYDIQDPPYGGQNLNNMSLKDLKKTLAGTYNQLECGYLYSAQLHLKLTRDTFLKKLKKNVTSETFEVFSFEYQVTAMIDSLLDPKHGRINELWLLHMYSRQMRVFFKQLTAHGGKVSRTVLTEIRRMNDYVLSSVGNRIKDRCAPENYFNMDYEKCEHRPFVDDPSQRTLGCILCPKITSGETHDGQINAIRANKQLLQLIFAENQNSRRMRFSNYHKLISDGCLVLFDDNNGFGSFVKEFLADNSEGVQVEFPGLRSEEKLTAINQLGAYQHRITGTLKIIILQITLSYTNRLVRSDDIPAYVRTFKQQVLDPFQHMMLWKDDRHFKDIYNEFSACEDNFAKCKPTLNEKIPKFIENITLKCRLPEIKSTVTDCDIPLDDVLVEGVQLVKKIQNDIGENQIRLVQSFLKMFDERKFDLTSLYNL